MTEILRAGLLDGVRILIAVPGGAADFAPTITDRTAALGAEVQRAGVDPAGDEIAVPGSNGASKGDEPSGSGSGESSGPRESSGPGGPSGSSGSGSRGSSGLRESAESAVDVLVWDATAARSALAAIDGAWLAVRPVAMQAMAGGGLVVLIAPRPGEAQAEATRAGLETMARTLSIEWARFAIRPVAILPGADTPASEVAELVAYLASPAGAYFSGCRFDLGSV